MKIGTSTFALTAAIVTVVVGVLALGAWFTRIAVITYLSNPHTYGDVEVTPHGYTLGGPLTHSWDSVTVKQGDNVYTVKDFNLDITILGEGKGGKVSLVKAAADPIKGVLSTTTNVTNNIAEDKSDAAAD